LERLDESSPLLSQNISKNTKTIGGDKCYKDAGIQTSTPPSISEVEASRVRDQIVMQDVTFVNQKTRLEETRAKAKGTYAAWLGDTRHRLDCQLAIGYLNDRELQSYVSAKSQAAFMQAYYPDFVPQPNPNGTLPSDHTVATAFEILYHTKEDFDTFYLETTFPHI